MRSTKKDTSARNQYYSYLLLKRHNNYEYIERIFSSSPAEEPPFWMNSVKLSSRDIIAMQDPGVLRLKAEQFFVLSLSLAKLVDSGNLANFPKSVQQLFDEFGKYYSGEVRLSRVILTTQTFVLQQCKKVQYSQALHKEKQKQILHSLGFSHSVMIDDEDTPEPCSGSVTSEESPEPAERSMTVRDPGSVLKSHMERPKKTVARATPFNMLSIVNVPFDLNFRDVICGLCEMIKSIYGTFRDAGNMDVETQRQIQRLDRTINVHVLHPLCVMINEAAVKMVEKQMALLFP